MTDMIPSKALEKLRLPHTLENWNKLLKEADNENMSYSRFLVQIIEMEYESKLERERLARINRVRIPIEYAIETYPFKKQPKINRKKVMEIYDSMNYIGDNVNLLFIGPTGCGKSGIATAFLTHALNHGYKGRVIDFSELIHIIYQSRADHTEQKVVKKFVSYEVLLIDELGYLSCQINKRVYSLIF